MKKITKQAAKKRKAPKARPKPQVKQASQKSPAKKIVPAKEKSGYKETRVGKVSHYFDAIKVAAIKLTAPLAVGDEIRIEGGEMSVRQIVESMQIEHEKVQKAGKGKNVGIKVKKKVREGYRVYRVSA